jgi:hypothetical protein
MQAYINNNIIPFVNNSTIFDKTFWEEGEGINVLLLSNSKNECINLFTPHQKIHKLSDILTLIPPQCTCTFVDFSCSTTQDYYTQEELDSSGGKKTKSKKKTKKKKTKSKKI